jgi:hypothetical protein
VEYAGKAALVATGPKRAKFYFQAKAKNLKVGLAGAAALLVVSACASPDEVISLSNRVSALESRLNALEARASQLQADLDAVSPPEVALAATPTAIVLIEDNAESSAKVTSLQFRTPVRASRLFTGPDEYPPDKFAAYGILAFRSRASLHDRDRHLMICEAYIAGLPHSSELALLDIHLHDQMVTVWPVDSDSSAEKLNHMSRKGTCEIAVESYGLTIARAALFHAERAGMAISGIGPFLLAWSPSTDKGKPDALVLVADLSNVTTYRQAQEILLRWSRDIEQDPRLWRKGWDLERVRREIQLWVDAYGSSILTLVRNEG